VSGRNAYPRPQLRRKHWLPLSGEWEFTTDAEGSWEAPDQVVSNTRIQLPFSPETIIRARWHAAISALADFQLQPRYVKDTQ
jgi:hypothetical protein